MEYTKNLEPVDGRLVVDDVIDLRAVAVADHEAILDLRVVDVPRVDEAEVLIDIERLEQLVEFEKLVSFETIGLAPSAPSVQPSMYRTKRFVDLAVLAMAIVPGLLIAAVAAVAIKATSRGPVFFCQPRMGLAGNDFVCFKFRTMLDGKNPLVPDATRITSAGKWLRRFSFDELPQLINVARGEMSMVGPRPMLPVQAEQCSPEQMRRLTVRPGLTGWAQINGRNSITWSQRIDLDLEYVDRQSARFDARIVLGTARTLISGAGVEGHDENDRFVVEAAKNDA